MVVAVGLLVVVMLASAGIFKMATDSVSLGQANNEAVNTFSAIADALRKDLAAMPAGARLFIRHESVGESEGSTSPSVRVDRLVFFTVDPETNQNCRIFYGHTARTPHHFADDSKYDYDKSNWILSRFKVLLNGGQTPDHLSSQQRNSDSSDTLDKWDVYCKWINDDDTALDPDTNDFGLRGAFSYFKDHISADWWDGSHSTSPRHDFGSGEIVFDHDWMLRPGTGIVNNYGLQSDSGLGGFMGDSLPDYAHMVLGRVGEFKVQRWDGSSWQPSSPPAPGSPVTSPQDTVTYPGGYEIGSGGSGTQPMPVSLRITMTIYDSQLNLENGREFSIEISLPQ
jgi:hypothetical protein